jgi:hypothetical protein
MNMRMMVAGGLAAVAMAAPAAQAQTEARPQVMLAPEATPPDLVTAQQERAVRARDNLVALRQGRIAVTDLTPEEQQDVIDLDRMTRGEGADNRSVRQQCIDDEVRRAGGRPSRLAWEAIRLKCR